MVYAVHPVYGPGFYGPAPHLPAASYPLAVVGAPMPAAANDTPDVTKDTVGFLATVPQLLAVGIVAGAAFALGNALVHRLVLKKWT